MELWVFTLFLMRSPLRKDSATFSICYFCKIKKIVAPKYHSIISQNVNKIFTIILEKITSNNLPMFLWSVMINHPPLPDVPFIWEDSSFIPEERVANCDGPAGGRQPCTMLNKKEKQQRKSLGICISSVSCVATILITVPRGSRGGEGHTAQRQLTRAGEEREGREGGERETEKEREGGGRQ